MNNGKSAKERTDITAKLNASSHWHQEHRAEMTHKKSETPVVKSQQNLFECLMAPRLKALIASRFLFEWKTSP